MNSTEENQEYAVQMRHGKPPLPIDGRYPEFGQAVRHLLGWYTEDNRPYLSSRDVQRMTGITNSAVAMMARGGRVAPVNLKKFADAVGGDYNQLMRLAGWTPDTSDPLRTLGYTLPDTLFRRTLVSEVREGAEGASEISDITEDAGAIGDRLPEGLWAIAVTGPVFIPLFSRGDILFIREMSSPHDGQKVIARTSAGVVVCRVWRNGEPSYLEESNGEPAIRSGFRIVGVVEYALRRA